MKHNKVRSVMTTPVVRATYGTPFKEVARLAADHRISGLPVVDEDEKVICVTSETDLLARQAETPDLYEPMERKSETETMSLSASRRCSAISRPARPDRRSH